MICICGVAYALYRELTKEKPLRMFISGGVIKDTSTKESTHNNFPQTGVLNNFILRTVPLRHFVWTEKTDGLRTELNIKGKNTTNIKTSESINIPFKHSIKETILNTEYLNNKYYIFDSPKVDGTDISSKHFLERYEIIKSFISSNDSNDILQLKQYSPITNPEELTDFIQNTTSPTTGNNIDGVILQRTDTSYWIQSSYKYKRPVMNTVDFMLKYVPESNSFYLYLYGSYTKLIYNLQRIPKTNKYSKKHTGVDLKDKHYPDSFSILFSSPFFANCHIFKPEEHWHRKGYKKDDISIINELMNKIIKKPINYDEKIIEMSWSEGGWVPYRERPDKTKPNSYMVGEKNMELLFSPVDFSGNHYFESNIDESELNTLYHRTNKLIRKNMINRLLTAYPTKSILDIAGGRGADSNYFIENGVNAIFATDADTEALITYQNRLLKIKKKDLSFNAIHWKLDVDNTPMINEITKRYEYNDKFDVAIMDYAIHYICDSNEKLSELARTVRKLVKLEGVFMITYFDGDSILSRAKDNILKLHSFTIKINPETNTVLMPLPTIDRSGYREEPLVTKERLSNLGLKIIDEYDPASVWSNELKKIDSSEEVLDLLQLIKVIIFRM